jgi:hypothetical protein
MAGTNMMMSRGMQRSFILALPSDYTPSRSYPLAFGWHWLNASGGSFLDKAEGQIAIDRMQFILAMPNATGMFSFTWPATPLDIAQSDVDLTFFDDMLACITEQYNINRNCVASIGVSAGGLWTTYLGTQRGEYLNVVESLSGGIGDTGGVPYFLWQETNHKYAGLVLWGGPSDWLVISFSSASMRYSSELRSHGHFAYECEHTSGHGVPPIEPVGDLPRFAPLWQFILDHPYWVPAGQSRYTTEGPPPTNPTWCRPPEPERWGCPDRGRPERW